MRLMLIWHNVTLPVLRCSRRLYDSQTLNVYDGMINKCILQYWA